jgi:hypothetical protein
MLYSCISNVADTTYSYRSYKALTLHDACSNNNKRDQCDAASIQYTPKALHCDNVYDYINTKPTSLLSIIL